MFTDEVPLGHIDYRDFIELVVNHNVRPERPEEEDIKQYGLSDAVWALAESCWQKDPKDRPTADVLCDMLLRLLEVTPRSVPPTISFAPIIPVGTSGKPPQSSTLIQMPAELSELPGESVPQNRAPAPSDLISWTSATEPEVFIILRVRALHTLPATEPGDLGFEVGDVIRVIDRGWRGWWIGELKGRTGIFPSNYVVSSCLLSLPHFIVVLTNLTFPGNLATAERQGTGRTG